MRIALTGGSGRIGREIARQALAAGHDVVSVDRRAPEDTTPADNLRFVLADTDDYHGLVAAFEGCDALIHMAAIPAPIGYDDHIVHNNNVVGSYNAMRAAIENGIRRICQASSVNAIGLAFSREAHFDYLPIDEDHPNYSEEPYSLSKWICEAQADCFVRRYEDLAIASLRFHYVVPDRDQAGAIYNTLEPGSGKHLWAYTLTGPAAQACLLGVTAPFAGHEVFYIVAPDTTIDIPSLELHRRFHPHVPIRGDLSGFRAFFDSSKAARILGWTHPEHPRQA
ncbi:MAG: NAD-dependent epimerase/dehydratase family protein [Inquilinaceae bacterium]